MNIRKLPKKERAEQARLHTAKMNENYSSEIKQSIQNTKIYNNNFRFHTDKSIEPDIRVIDADTVSAAAIEKDGKTAILNFASYKHAGGGFMSGSTAQEEALCHESFLYNVLSSFENDFYKYNRMELNRSLYLNKGLYSPNIMFWHNDTAFTCDVITVPAPNKSAALKHGVSEAENTKVLRARIKFVLEIFGEHNVDTLILGAFGCGVFGQNPEEVASIFKEYLTVSHKWFKKVVFAIPKDNRNKNLEAFKKVFP